MSLPDTFRAMRDELRSEFYERDDAIDAMLLALLTKEHCHLDGDPGCIYGDAKLNINRAGNGTTITLRELVRMQNGGTRNYKTWNPTIPTMVQRRAEDGTVRLARLERAWASGIKTTYEVTTLLGNTIRTTDEHPFLTDQGWKRLDELRVGDSALLRGDQAAHGPRRIKPIYRERAGLRFHPHAYKTEARHSPYRIAEHRLVIEAVMNGLSLDDYLAALRSGPTLPLTFLRPEQVVHHMNGDPRDNRHGNLEVLANQAEHNSTHEVTPRVLFKTVTDQIVSIEKYGEEETFDIEVADDPHNFIADGFVVHNTGKSALVRAVAKRITGTRYFEQVLSRTRPDAAVLGPYDINALRERSDFRRKDAGYLTTCDIGYLDEIFKMSPTLGHDLLAVLNERLKHEVDEKGLTAHKVPLWTTFTSSNEIPHEPDEQALWDRILLRVRVEPIKLPANVHALLTATSEPGLEPRTTLKLAGLRVAHFEAMDVTIPAEVTDLVQELRRDLRDQGITVSDRRWRASMKVARAQAWLSGHETVCATDLAPLRHVLWSSPEEMKPVRLEVQRFAQPDLRVVSSLEDDLDELVHAWKQGAGQSDAARMQHLVELRSKIGQLCGRLRPLVESSPLPEASMAASALMVCAEDALKAATVEVGLGDLVDL